MRLETSNTELSDPTSRSSITSNLLTMNNRMIPTLI